MIPCRRILQPHVSYDYESGGEVGVLPGERKPLATRRKRDDYWIASVATEFGCVLANRLAKAKLDERRQERLSNLFDMDPQGCASQWSHLLDPDGARVVSMAVRTRRWDDVVGQLELLRNGLLNRKRRTGAVGQWMRRAKRWLKPDCGLHAVFLGPDGVGKSTVIEAVKEHLSGAFLRTDYFTFAPSLIPQKLQPEKKTPHQLLPRRIRRRC